MPPVSINCNVICILPTVFQAWPGQPQQIEGDVKDARGMASVINKPYEVDMDKELPETTFLAEEIWLDRIVFAKLVVKMTQNLQPLYITVLLMVVW